MWRRSCLACQNSISEGCRAYSCHWALVLPSAPGRASQSAAEASAESSTTVPATRTWRPCSGQKKFSAALGLTESSLPLRLQNEHSGRWLGGAVRGGQAAGVRLQHTGRDRFVQPLPEERRRVRQCRLRVEGRQVGREVRQSPESVAEGFTHSPTLSATAPRDYRRERTTLSHFPQESERALAQSMH